MENYNITRCGRNEDSFIKAFVADIRPIDAEEARAVSPLPIGEIIAADLMTSLEAYKVETSDGRPLAIFGVAHPEGLMAGVHLIWCLGTNLLQAEFRKSFVKVSRQILIDWANRYGILINAVSPKNRHAVRWLKWLGAELKDSQPVGLNGEEFSTFILTKEGLNNV